MTILITGFAGSLGSAFTNYLLSEGHTVIGVDNNEWATAAFPDQDNLEKVLADVEDIDYKHFQQSDVLIHCAAYKHVNLGEANVVQFARNNVSKTRTLFDRAYSSGLRILFISTDKAVEPISSYGYTKALGEAMCRNYNGYVARLGNILNSNGSVIPLWEKQIANLEPITITDRACTRYVIEVEDAVKQIWAGFLKGDKLIIPDMGEPRNIMDILLEVLKRHGYDKLAMYTPGIDTIGLRPGEKLHEKLRWDYE